MLIETGCLSVRTAACSHTCRNWPASKKSRGPSPLEVEPADPSVIVEALPDQVMARYQLQFHRPEVNFFEWHATGCDLGVVPAPIVFDWEFELVQPSEQTTSIFSRQLGHRPLGSHLVWAQSVSVHRSGSVAPMSSAMIAGVGRRLLHKPR